MIRLLLALAVALTLAQGLYYARVLVPSHDAVQYLLVGQKVVRGEIGIYDDRLPGNRLPLPFYILGLTQWQGPDLYAARHLNIAIGCFVVLLTGLLGYKLGGAMAGGLSALFLATQGVIVAYFSTEGYPAISALALVVCLLALAHQRWMLGAFLAGLLFLVRSNLWPAAVMLGGYAVWKVAADLAQRPKRAGRLGSTWDLGTGRGLTSRVSTPRHHEVFLASVVVRRAATLAFFFAPLVIFLASDPTHLKVLAYVPGLKYLVAPLGYMSVLTLDDRTALPFYSQLWEAARLVRRYEFWALALAVLLVYRGWRGLHKPLTIFLGACLAVMAAMYYWNMRWLGLYFVPYAPAFAVLLGLGYAPMLRFRTRQGWDGNPWRMPAVALLMIVLLVPPLVIARNPLLPPWGVRGEALKPVLAEAAELKKLVPADANVYYYGIATVPYLGGVPITHLEQFYTPTQLPRIPVDEYTVKRSGLVPPSVMRSRLKREADYAIINQRMLDEGRADLWLHEHEMEALVKEYFQVVGRAGDLVVWRRVVRDADVPPQYRADCSGQRPHGCL